MLFRSTAQIDKEFYLITLGDSCHYLLWDGTQCILFDPGTSAHIPALLKRIESLGIPHSAITQLFITTPDPFRIAGVPLLKSKLPSLLLTTSSAIHDEIKSETVVDRLLDWDHRFSHRVSADNPSGSVSLKDTHLTFQSFKTVPDTAIISRSENLAFRVMPFPCATPQSVAVYVPKNKALLGDVGLGVYRTRLPASPGSRSSLSLTKGCIEKFRDSPLSFLGLPHAGVLTGTLIKKHLDGVVEGAESILLETREALGAGVSFKEAIASIRDYFFRDENPTVLSTLIFEYILEGISEQINYLPPT